MQRKSLIQNDRHTCSISHILACITVLWLQLVYMMFGSLCSRVVVCIWSADCPSFNPFHFSVTTKQMCSMILCLGMVSISDELSQSAKDIKTSKTEALQQRNTSLHCVHSPQCNWQSWMKCWTSVLTSKYSFFVTECKYKYSSQT